MEIDYLADKLVCIIPGFIVVIVIVVATLFEKSDIELHVKYTKKNKQ